MARKSTYKQVRITLTEELDREAPGMRCISVRVSVKPLNEEWTMRHVVLSERRRNMPPLSDLQAVYRTVLDMLAQEPLPGHIDS